MRRKDKAEGLVPDPREDLCLSFANTLSWRGSDAPVEEIAGFPDLVAWCRRARVIPAGAANALLAWSRSHRQLASDAHGESVALREALYPMFAAVSEGGTILDRDFAVLSRAVAEAPARQFLARDGKAFGWRLEPIVAAEAGPLIPALLAPVLWSAADLLTGSGGARVRRCANAKCLWLFLDESKSASRRWCDMAACGNRAKAQRHYLRSKAR